MPDFFWAWRPATTESATECVLVCHYVMSCLGQVCYSRGAQAQARASFRFQSSPNQEVAREIKSWESIWVTPNPVMVVMTWCARDVHSVSERGTASAHQLKDSSVNSLWTFDFQLCKSAETPVQRGALWKNGFRLPLNICNYKSTLIQHSHWRHWRNTGKFEHDLKTLKPCVVLKSCLQFWNSHSPPFTNPLYIKLWSVVNLFLSIFHVAKSFQPNQSRICQANPFTRSTRGWAGGLADSWILGQPRKRCEKPQQRLVNLTETLRTYWVLMSKS
jgi:hypothetical protein